MRLLKIGFKKDKSRSKPIVHLLGSKHTILKGTLLVGEYADPPKWQVSDVCLTELEVF
ncbi:hypothetical protein [Pseudoalteromonas luteoviolacea]|uniref:hypothetical protein n=1 Tax=Pseudoalteromonas luteoviolacea TaxID=43657 RepID=UPI0012DAEAE1|nr:hypothetical protein [Pseudoalteromonas luteoviolacea]